MWRKILAAGFAKPPRRVYVRGVLLLWFILVPVLLIIAVFWFGRRHIAIRRPNCCGKGCGCLFPVKLPEKKPE